LHVQSGILGLSDIATMLSVVDKSMSPCPGAPMDTAADTEVSRRKPPRNDAEVSTSTRARMDAKIVTRNPRSRSRYNQAVRRHISVGWITYVGIVPAAQTILIKEAVYSTIITLQSFDYSARRADADRDNRPWSEWDASSLSQVGESGK
jgi:hypothetical protein